MLLQYLHTEVAYKNHLHCTLIRWLVWERMSWEQQSSWESSLATWQERPLEQQEDQWQVWVFYSVHSLEYYYRGMFITFASIFHYSLQPDEMMRLYHRFYITLILHSLLKLTTPDSIWRVADKFHCSRGFLQSIMNSTASYTSCLVHFTAVSYLCGIKNL